MIIEQTKDLRIINRIKVIQKMLSDSNYSRARLCKETGLNKATISTIVKEWMDWGLIEETTLACSTGGRKPILLQIIKNSGYSISIDIQLKSFQVVIANLKNEIIQTILRSMDYFIFLLQFIYLGSFLIFILLFFLILFISLDPYYLSDLLHQILFSSSY